MALKEYVCDYCEEVFIRYESEAKRSENKYCSTKCSHKMQEARVVCNCDNCGKRVIRRKYQFDKVAHHFCSRSCAAIYNNKHRIRKEGVKAFCIKCGKGIDINTRQRKSARKKYCNECNPNIVDWSKVTLGQLKKESPQRFHQRIRAVSYSIYKKSDKPKKCIICGYDKHYEICHIVPISHFSDDTSISVINDPNDQLYALCRNHHWELDHKLLSSEDLIILLQKLGHNITTNDAEQTMEIYMKHGTHIFSRLSNVIKLKEMFR